MTETPDTVPLLPLFVPASRLDRLDRAEGSGADVVLVDLEDAIESDRKDEARNAAARALEAGGRTRPVWVRINGPGTPWYGDDVTAVSALPVSGVVLPMVSRVEEVLALRARLPGSLALITLIETAGALADVREIARVSDRLIFGSLDYALSLGARPERESLLHARSGVVLASVLANRPPPLDGITTSYTDLARIEEDARHAADLGFGGRLLIHPAQVAPSLRGFAPPPADVEAARRALAAGTDAARGVDGSMVDTPVVAAARSVMARHALVEARLRTLNQGGKGHDV